MHCCLRACGPYREAFTIRFFSTGMSCGGSLFRLADWGMGLSGARELVDGRGRGCSRPTALKGTAGFTLILEAMVALAIVAVALGSIGALIASSARGNRSIEGHLTPLETARAIIDCSSVQGGVAPGGLCRGRSQATLGGSMSCPSQPKISIRGRTPGTGPRKLS